MTTTLADEVLRSVHAFPDKKRRDAIRDLAKRIAELDSERSRLAEALGKVVGRQLRERKELRALVTGLCSESLNDQPSEWRGGYVSGKHEAALALDALLDRLTTALDALEAGR